MLLTPPNFAFGDEGVASVPIEEDVGLAVAAECLTLGCASEIGVEVEEDQIAKLLFSELACRLREPLLGSAKVRDDCQYLAIVRLGNAWICVQIRALHNRAESLGLKRDFNAFARHVWSHRNLQCRVKSGEVFQLHSPLLNHRLNGRPYLSAPSFDITLDPARTLLEGSPELLQLCGSLLGSELTVLDLELHYARRDLHIEEELVMKRAPQLVDQFGVGIDTAAEILIVVGENPERIHSEAAFAKLAGISPVPTGSGTTSGKNRINHGGHRQLNAAIYRTVIVRMQHHEPTKVYIARHTAEGKSKRDIIRCLKRYVIREVYQLVKVNPSPVEITS